MKAGIKAGLEGLQGVVPGLQSVHVQIDGVLPSSTADISQAPRPALLPDAWHRPLFHFPHYEPERSAAPTYTHDLEQMHPKAHARDGRGSMLSNDRPQSSPGGGSTDGL